jgi:hypothetical protein
VKAISLSNPIVSKLRGARFAGLEQRFDSTMQGVVRLAGVQVLLHLGTGRPGKETHNPFARKRDHSLSDQGCVLEIVEAQLWRNLIHEAIVPARRVEDAGSSLDVFRGHGQCLN